VEKEPDLKTAFAHWDGRVAPVFDVARSVLVVESEGDALLSETEARMPSDSLAGKAAALSRLGVETLVCGAISRILLEIIAARDIRIVPFVAGELKKVVQAWLGGGLAGPSFRMPGCGFGGGGRRAWSAAGRGSGTTLVIGRGAGGGGLRRGGGAGPGRLSGSPAAGIGGACVCPKCGRREAHQRGIPCVLRTCPHCGTAMMRE
jgi:predicted Fe-Mo cluster-binding NifX family protein